METEDICGDLSVCTADSLRDALDNATPSEEDVYLVFGSLSIMQLFDDLMD